MTINEIISNGYILRKTDQLLMCNQLHDDAKFFKVNLAATFNLSASVEIRVRSGVTGFLQK